MKTHKLIDEMQSDLERIKELNLIDDDIVSVNLCAHRECGLHLKESAFIRVARQLGIKKLIAWDIAQDQLRFRWAGWSFVACNCEIDWMRMNGFTITVEPT